MSDPSNDFIVELFERTTVEHHTDGVSVVDPPAGPNDAQLQGKIEHLAQSQGATIRNEVKSSPQFVDPAMREGRASTVPERHGGRMPLSHEGDLRRIPHAGVDVSAIATVISTVAISLGGTGAAVLFLRTAREVLVQWLKNRGHREITIKRGTLVVKVRGTASLEDAMRMIEQLPATEPEKARVAIKKSRSKKDAN